MSSYRTKTPAEQIADGISERKQMLANHIAKELRAMYEAVDTSGLQQEILDAFDSSAVVLRDYEAMRQTLAVIDPSAVVPIPNPEVFQLLEDGTVKYVAPVVDSPAE